MSKLTPGAIADALECARCFTPECEHHPGSFATFEAALEAVKRVRELHEPFMSHTSLGSFLVCEICGMISWPCPTIAALEGEGPNE